MYILIINLSITIRVIPLSGCCTIYQFTNLTPPIPLLAPVYAVKWIVKRCQ